MNFAVLFAHVSFKCRLLDREQGPSERRTLCECTGHMIVKPGLAAGQEETRLLFYSFQVADSVRFRQYHQASDIYGVPPVGR